MTARRLPSAQQLQLEGVLLAGGLRALLLQLAHPAVGHGVATHSAFESDPLARLWGTLRYVYVVAAGDEQLVHRAARAVGAAHRPVVGSAPVAYDARDPRLQLWVAATLHDSALRIVEAVWGRLPDPLADELLGRMGRLGSVLGLPEGEWPADRAAFARLAASFEAELRFDETTLPVVRALVAARGTPRWVRFAMPLLLAATLPTVPGIAPSLRPLVRRGTPDLLPHARRIAPAWRLLPVRLRLLPARRLLASARASLPPA